MKRISSKILFASLMITAAGFKSSPVLNIKQDLTPEEAVVKLWSIIEKENSGATTGLEDMVTGGETTVTKDSITFHKTIQPVVDKSTNSFTSGYETTSIYKESRDLVVSVRFNRVNDVKIREFKDGRIRITIKDDNEFFLTRPMYQFDTTGSNRELVVALFSVLIPDVNFNFSGSKERH